MMMPGRKYSTSSYRYGFNGKENDREISYIDYVSRMYDPNLGRFTSIDALYRKYPSESNYSYAGNNPIYMIDKDGNKKTTYIITVDDRTGKTTIRQIHSNELHKKKVEVMGSAFGVNTHDYTTKYEWYDITSIQVTHIGKDGKSTTTTITNNEAKLRTTTNFDWGQGYANVKIGDAAITKIFKPTKESSVEDGYIETTPDGGKDNKYNKVSVHNPKMIDVKLLLATLNTANTASGVEEMGNIFEKLVYLVSAIGIANDIQDNRRDDKYPGLGTSSGFSFKDVKIGHVFFEEGVDAPGTSRKKLNTNSAEVSKEPATDTIKK